MTAPLESYGPLGDAAATKAPDFTESVAGEEDPGASIDLASAATGPGGNEPTGGQAPMSPGDEAPPGTPGTGEDVCPRCGGTGKLAGGDCPMCQGTGKVTTGIGGG